MPTTVPASRRAALLGAALALICTLAAAGTAQAQGIYVALGDSYTSGPLVPMQHGDPIDCGRSDHNYPSLVNGAFGYSTFVDVSCGSAQTKDMTQPQTDLPLGGTNPPQFNALRPDATVVTVGIGGNDVGLVGVGEKCGQMGATNPTGHSCRDYYAPGGHDTIAAKIEATKPKIAVVLRGIHERSPNARVAIVGYPDVLPQNGGSCYPLVPLSPDDVRYADELIRRINSMIAGQAALNDAEYVDTYTDSIGHDVCTLPPVRWFEGIVPTQPAYPLHPNELGEASMARSTIRVLNRPRPVAIDGPEAPVLSNLSVSPARVRAGRGATIRYKLDRPARVTFTVRRALSGRRAARRCVAVRRRNRGARHCTRFSGVVVKATVASNSGAHMFTLTARHLGRQIGSYRLTAAPVSEGMRGVARSTSFSVVPSRR